MGTAFNKSVREDAPQVVIYIDPSYSDLRLMPMSSRKCFVATLSRWWNRHN
jgi:hypothetical protein